MQALDNASAPIPIMVPDQAPITARTNVIAARDQQLCDTRHFASPAESCVTTSLRRRDADDMIRDDAGEGQRFRTALLF